MSRLDAAASRGTRTPRPCQNPAHEIFGGPVDLNDFPWVHKDRLYCHDNCKNQASEIRTGKVKHPRHLASNPPGWGRPAKATQANGCKCHECPGDHKPECELAHNPLLDWHSPKAATCLYCGKPVDLQRLRNRQRSMERERLSSVPPGGPAFRSTSVANPPVDPRYTTNGGGKARQDGKQPKGYLEDLERRRKIEDELAAAESEDAAIAVLETTVPDDGEARAACRAHEGVAV